MRLFIYLLSIPLFLLSCQIKKPVASYIQNYEHHIAKNKSWEYDINFKMKYFKSDEDTINYNSNVRLIKHKSDSIFGGSFWIKDDSIDRYYDLQHIYVINHKNKIITKFFPHNGQDWAINGNTIRGVLNSYFLKENRLSHSFKDPTTMVRLYDTIFRDSKRYAVELSYKDDLPIEKQRKTLYFNKDTRLKHIIYSVKFQNEWQYNEWHFTNEQYNHITDKDLELEFYNLMENYQIEDYKAPDPKEMEPIAKGVKAPVFKGFHLQHNDSINLKDFSGKYVLIDFWYKDCFPCINAIASLNKLRAKYSKNDLAILGLNPFDNKEKVKKKLMEFMEINKMGYPTIFVDNKVIRAYNVRAFPTFYIINRKGEIVYSGIGFDEKIEKEIDSLLHKWLN